VADFGIARAVSSTSVTRTGALLGTAHYSSPEQAMGQPATFQSDLYSLGVVLYEMLTGEVPHDAETPIDVAMKHANGPLQPPREVNPAVPEGLNAVVMRLLAKNPEERYGDTIELIADLERVERGESPATRREEGNYSPTLQETVLDNEEVGPTHTPQAPPPSGERLVLMATAVGILLVLLTGGGAMALTGLGPGGLLGGSENEPAEESASAQTSDVQEAGAAEDEAIGEESAEQTTSFSDDSSGTSSTPSGGGNTGQVPAAQSEQGNQTAVVSPTSGTSTQEDTTPKDDSIEVPKLIGLSVPDAISELTDVGLKLGDRKEAPSDNVDPGKVVSQNPVPGTKMERGSTVSIVCSCSEP
jgi:serine/threonine protein kinase